jgi:hypothetical protein
VRRLEAVTPAPPPPEQRPKLARCLAIIDALNDADPKKVPLGPGGADEPYRRAYGRAVYEQVLALDPRAPDALLILAKGRQVESWRIPKLFKRDDYAPNTPGTRQYEGDRRRWQARRLLRCAREAGYRGPLTPSEASAAAAARAQGEADPLADLPASAFDPVPADAPDAEAAAEEAAALRLIDGVVARTRNGGVPDPRDLRPYDFAAPLGATNWPLLRAAMAVQALADADALVFLDLNFARMVGESGMTADEAAGAARRELGRMSAAGMAAALQRPWLTPPLKKVLYRSLPVPFKYSDIMLDAEGTAAASVHPGDWRYRDFDYE